MPKSDSSFDPAEYAPVAERIQRFFERYPEGRITSRLVSAEHGRFIFSAAVYRSPEEARPAATGWALEWEGDGDINTVACLENTETSAIGRALANLGFTAARQRPSLEEMVKAQRAREQQPARPAGSPGNPGTRARPGRVAEPPAVFEARQRQADQIATLSRLLSAAARLGMREERADRYRAALLAGRLRSPAALGRVEHRLRQWLLRNAGALDA